MRWRSFTTSGGALVGVDVVLISRGLCAPEVTRDAVLQAAQYPDVGFWIVSGRSCVEAKQAAVRAVGTEGQDLMILEDDVLLTDEQWREMLTPGPEILVGECACRNGEWNTHKLVTQEGLEILYSGSVALRIPAAVLRRLPETGGFEARLIYVQRDPLVWEDRGPAPTDSGSDLSFWYHVWHLDPRPAVRSIGEVVHLRTPLNDGTGPDGPIPIGRFEPRE